MTLPEGNPGDSNNGKTPFVFDVTWFMPDNNLPNGQTVTVQYYTTDGTASTTTDNDYVPIPITAPNTLTFTKGGPTTLPITITVNGDTTDEPDETFFVHLKAVPGQPQASTSPATGTIQNDDLHPTLTVSSVAVNEGQDITFTLSLSAVSGKTITLGYNTADLPAADLPAGGGLAEAGVDYTAIPPNPPQMVTFLPGETTKLITVHGLADNLPNEPARVFPTGADQSIERDFACPADRRPNH